MELDEFEKLIGEIFDAIPPKYRDALGNTFIVAEDEYAGDPELLGCFEGISGIEQSINDIAPLPNRIVIYRFPTIDEAAETDGDITRVVRETLIHEIAHALGYEEREIEEKFESRWQQH
jgi:predicted Zn-dependent protease with MMP-like domain